MERRKKIVYSSVQFNSVAQSCSTLGDLMDLQSTQTPLSMGFSWQEHWSGLPFPMNKEEEFAKIQDTVNDSINQIITII